MLTEKANTYIIYVNQKRKKGNKNQLTPCCVCSLNTKATSENECLSIKLYKCLIKSCSIKHALQSKPVQTVLL